MVDDAVDLDEAAKQQQEWLCVECGDQVTVDAVLPNTVEPLRLQPASKLCVQCSDKFCDVCFQAQHKRGSSSCPPQVVVRIWRYGTAASIATATTANITYARFVLIVGTRWASALIGTCIAGTLMRPIRTHVANTCLPGSP